MHELSVCLSVLDQVRSIARERGAARATRVEVTVWPLSGVESELLRNAWPIATAGSLAAEAELVIEDAPIVVHCDACGADSRPPQNRLACPVCDDFRTTLVSGDEMILQRVELER